MKLTDARATASGHTTWKLYVHPTGSAEWHMELDRSLLQRLESQPEPETALRFYGWSRRTLSLGYHQVIDAELAERARKLGVGCVPRPTGGRAVLHGRDFTYSLVSNDATFFRRDFLRENYCSVSRALRLGLRLAGVPAEFSRRDAGRSYRSKLSCFSSATRFELSSGGRKLVGSAQRRLRRAFLQHGSIPIEDGSDVAGPLLGERESEATCLAHEMGIVPSFSFLCAVFSRAFQHHFGVQVATVQWQEYK
ncbi:MAG: lipoate--protein ligase family protein [Acidobacteriota bacterium]